MRGWVKAGTTATAALALSAFGAVPASAGEQPEPGPWTSYDDSYTLPAGFACKSAVEVRQRGRYRITDLGHGKIAYEYADWSRVTWTNPTKHRSYSRLEGGDTVEKQVSSSVIKVRAEGDNWGQGSGIYGIPWSHGKISYTVIRADGPNYRFVDVDFSHAKKVVQVCYKIGSKPVRGRNVPAES